MELWKPDIMIENLHLHCLRFKSYSKYLYGILKIKIHHIFGGSINCLGALNVLLRQSLGGVLIYLFIFFNTNWLPI